MPDEARLFAVERELNNTVLGAFDEILAFELLDIVALWPQMPRLTKRATEIANDIPVIDGAVALHVVQRVVRVLQIPAVEDEKNDEEPPKGKSVDKRIVLPCPRTASVQRRFVQSEPSSGFELRSLRVGQFECRQVIHGRLMVAN